MSSKEVVIVLRLDVAEGVRPLPKAPTRLTFHPSDQRFEPGARAPTNDDVGSGILFATAGAGAPLAHRTARR